MNKPELVQAVIEITGRPDQGNLIKQAVQAATLQVHSKDLFKRDVNSQFVTFASPLTDQVVAYKDIFARFRLFDSVIICDANQVPLAGPLEMIPVSHFKDVYGVIRPNVCVLAGDNLYIKSDIPFKYALIAAYEFPVITDAGYSSWVADSYPYAVIYAAASAVFRALKDPTSAGTHKNLAEEAMAQLLADQISLGSFQ
jgi:hypothetical protein